MSDFLHATHTTAGYLVHELTLHGLKLHGHLLEPTPAGARKQPTTWLAATGRHQTNPALHLAPAPPRPA